MQIQDLTLRTATTITNQQIRAWMLQENYQINSVQDLACWGQKLAEIALRCWIY